MESKKAGKPKVLIVDDDLVSLLVVQKLLEAQGYDVFVARSIWEAARQLEQGCVDVLVTDVTLERGSFHELHRMMTIDGRESAPYKTVIVMSATMTPATQQAFWRYGGLIHELVHKTERVGVYGDAMVSEHVLVVAVRSALASIGIEASCT